MKKQLIILLVLGTCLVILFLVIKPPITRSIQEHEAQMKLDSENVQIPLYAATTKTRLDEAVITIPDLKDTLAGLKAGKGTFAVVPGGALSGTVTLGEPIVTKFVEGKLNVRDPHLDALVPVSISQGGSGTFVYVMLFNDRGDAAILKSYVYLGDRVSVTAIKIVDSENKDEEYKVEIDYLGRALNESMSVRPRVEKKVVIPVADGHFVE